MCIHWDESIKFVRLVKHLPIPKDLHVWSRYAWLPVIFPWMTSKLRSKSWRSGARLRVSRLVGTSEWVSVCINTLTPLDPIYSEEPLTADLQTRQGSVHEVKSSPSLCNTHHTRLRLLAAPAYTCLPTTPSTLKQSISRSIRPTNTGENSSDCIACMSVLSFHAPYPYADEKTSEVVSSCGVGDGWGDGGSDLVCMLKMKRWGLVNWHLRAGELVLDVGDTAVCSGMQATADLQWDHCLLRYCDRWVPALRRLLLEWCWWCVDWCLMGYDGVW